MKKFLVFLSLVLILFSAGKIFAQSGSLPVQKNTIQVLSANCTDGLVYDDNSFENGYGWIPNQGQIRWVMKFTPISYPYSINHLCLAITRTSGGAQNWIFSIVVFDTVAAGGIPGNIVDSIGMVAINVPIWPLITIYEFNDITSIPTLYTGSYYIGISSDPNTMAQHYIGADESPTTIRHTGFGWTQGNWFVIQSYYAYYKALGIRTEEVITGVSENSNEIPKAFKLYNNFPNPFNPRSTIKFDLPKSTFTKLIIYDILGHEVSILINEELKPGSYEFQFNGDNYASGVYFYKLETVDFVKTEKMVLLK